MRIAIIGTGISGLVSAYHLNKHNNIDIFESESWIGGHTHTVSYNNLNIDTGFIVFNDRTYPNFQKLLDFFSVAYRPTEMSFSVRNDNWKLEYNGNNLNSLFSDRKNIFNPKFYRMLSDILRFNKLLKSQNSIHDETLGSFVLKHRFSEWFINGYILPMGSAIWSMGTLEMLDFPLKFFTKFFMNHGLLDIFNRPQWFTIVGGSCKYIEPLTQSFRNKIHLNSKVDKVIRDEKQVALLVNGVSLKFDKVIFACHSDQALKLLDIPTNDEFRILSNIIYSKNEVVLHTDTALLPRKKLSNASWNYLISKNSNKQATVTYNMNILQGLNSAQTYCVTLNATNLIDPNKILEKFEYSHPVYSRDMVISQEQVNLISGKNNTHFCGAYWRNGFHEDGVISALRVCRELGVEIVY